MEENKILGKNLKDWRKAYFGGKLNDLLDAVASKKTIKQSELDELDKYLAKLEKEREKLKTSVAKYAKSDKMKLPEVSELMAMTKEQLKDIEEWEKEREKDYKRAREIMELAKAGNKLGIHNTQWLDWANELITLQYNLDVLRVWKDQLYRGKLVNIMDTYSCSRAEAEERAKLTREYMNYKNAILFRELVEEAVMLCKKYYSA